MSDYKPVSFSPRAHAEEASKGDPAFRKANELSALPWLNSSVRNWLRRSAISLRKSTLYGMARTRTTARPPRKSCTPASKRRAEVADAPPGLGSRSRLRSGLTAMSWLLFGPVVPDGKPG